MLEHRGAGVVPGDRVIGQPPQQIEVAGGGGELEAAHPQMAGGDAGQHGARQRRLALHPLARRDHGQRAGGRDAQRVHRLADDVLAQHRADGRQPVAAAGKRGAARAFEVNVAEPAVSVDELAEQQRATIAQPRDIAAELVPGIGLCDGRGAVGNVVADQESQSIGTVQPGRVESQLAGQWRVEGQQPRLGEGPSVPTDGQLGQVAGEAVVQSNGGWVDGPPPARTLRVRIVGRIRCDAHLAQPTGGTGGDQPD